MQGKGEAEDRGAFATNPAELSRRAWGEIFRRVWTNSGRRNVGFLAAGVAFYGFLAFVPALALLVMMYALTTDPGAIAEQLALVVGILPDGAAVLVKEQLASLIETGAKTKGLALIPAFALSLYGASGASGSMISSLNIIYEQEEKRSIVRHSIIALALAAGALLVGFLGLLSASALGFLENFLGNIGTAGAMVFRALTWLLAGTVTSFVFAGVYRYAPCRRPARWRWIGLGSVIATVLWMLVSLLFGWYASLADYSASYGSLGAVVVLLMWFYLSAYAVLLGALIDAESERQTAADSTTGPDHPLGQRGAVMADTSAAASTTSST